MDHLKNKKSVVYILVIAIFVVCSSVMVGYGRPSGEELIIRNFMSLDTEYDRLILNGWTVIHDPDFKIDTADDFEKLVKPLFSSYYFTTTKYTAINSTTITARGFIKPKVTATITLIKHDFNRSNYSGEKHLVLSLESKTPDISYSFLNSTMRSFFGRDYHKSMVVSGKINRNLGPQDRDTFIKGVLRTMNVQNMETLVAGPLVSVTGYTPSVRNVLTVAGKSVNINMALRYSTIDNKTMVYVGSPLITSEY